MARLGYVDYANAASSLPSLSSAVPNDQHLAQYPRDPSSFSRQQRYDSRPRTPMFNMNHPNLNFESNYMTSTTTSPVSGSTPAYNNAPFTVAPWMQSSLSTSSMTPAVSAPMTMSMSANMPSSMAFNDQTDSYVFSSIMPQQTGQTLPGLSNAHNITPQSLSPEEAFLGMPDVGTGSMVLFEDCNKSDYSHSPVSQSGHMNMMSLDSPAIMRHPGGTQSHVHSYQQQQQQPQSQNLPHMRSLQNELLSQQDCEKTFSCTYSHCPSRFNTTEELQIHKKEAHRSGNSKPEITQKGPYICLRVNPNTGRQCGSQFNRPYDLTRHEATIHNLDREKFSCPICPDKTFSRFDALTRHYGHVHPNLPLPIKNKERKTHVRRTSKNNVRHGRRMSEDIPRNNAPVKNRSGAMADPEAHVSAISADASASWY
ncbi:hypothetical protein Cpir12675_001718 [Ceratocystis pirilliformis]|uniref:C2H2-type domain-containing protein n=1 Tax=Ceratocystis pirilliformis TaxID=259994 RepID=A0ABR3ZFX7_9PEZI